MSLWDTAGQEEFDRIRLLSYEDTHVFLLCFSIDNRDSLQNIQDKWMEEVLEYSGNAKFVLVALKCDLRQEKRNTILYEEVSFKIKRGEGSFSKKVNFNKQREPYINFFFKKKGLEMAKSINAIRYLECSAKQKRGVRECFEQSAKVALSGNR